MKPRLRTGVLVICIAAFAAATLPARVSPPSAVAQPERASWPLDAHRFVPPDDVAVRIAASRPARDGAPTVGVAPARSTSAAKTPDWSTLLAQADAGDPHAACELSLLLDDCRLAGEVGEMVDTQISMAASEGTDATAQAREIAQLEASIDPLRAACATVPPELVSRGWTYLLRAAIAGHEPSMFRFVTDLPVDPRLPPDRTDAWTVYRENAALFVGLLLQRASPEALALAFHAAQGVVFVGDRPIQARDPAAVVRLGTALIALREADEASEEGVARALAELPPSESLRARNEGRHLATRFLQRAAPGVPEAAAAVPPDECSDGWPGMQSRYTAYSY